MLDYVRQTRLEPEIARAISEGQLSGHQGTVIAKVEDLSLRKRLFRAIKKEGLSADATKVRALQWNPEAFRTKPKKQNEASDNHLETVFRSLRQVVALTMRGRELRENLRAQMARLEAF